MKAKKLVALLLAVVMVLGLGTTAFASSNEKVQVNNMMVDASMIGASQTIRDDAEDAIGTVFQLEAETASTQVTYYPPINNITVEGCTSSSMDVYTVENDSTIYYKIYTHGSAISAGQRTFTIQLSSGSGYMGSVRIADPTNSDNVKLIDYAGSANIDLNISSDKKAQFEASWRLSQNMGMNANCVIEFDTTDSVSLFKSATDLGASVTNVEGVSVVDKDLTAGGVTRYGRQFTLPASASATSLDLQFKLESGGASATLAGVAPSSVSGDNKTITFNSVDLTNPKELVITNGTNSRTYTISAATSQDITVYIGIRTYLAHEWISGSTTYYDYESNGFESGDGTADTQVTNALSYVESAMGGLIYPTGVDAITGRPYFTTYEPIVIHSGASVMDVLEAFADENGIYLEGVDNGYISGIGSAGNCMISEFDCGSGSGWMYTVRDTTTDFTSALPNVGATSKIVTAGQYIDWYYTAAYGMDFGYSIFDL